MNIFAEAVVCASLLFFLAKGSKRKPQLGMNSGIPFIEITDRVEVSPKKEASAKVAAEQKAEEDRAKLAHAEGLDTFQRAFGACMDARNYSVK